VTGHWAWVLLAVMFAGGVAVGGLVVSLAGSRREDRAYDEGRADERAKWSIDDPRDSSGPEQNGSERTSGHSAAVMMSSPPASGPEDPAEWEPEPADRVYQWAHPHPIRATAPLTVIDWDALPWEERQLLTVWDWGRRMQGWIEDWDRERLEAA